MYQKRKDPPSEPQPSSSPSTKRPRHEYSGHFPFLELPQELRDEVYRHVVESDLSATLQNRNLITKCGLVGVNNRICKEFLDAVLFYAPVINTTVRNHNFAHVVTFLNRLSEAQFKRFRDPAEETKKLKAKEKTQSKEDLILAEYRSACLRGLVSRDLAQKAIEARKAIAKKLFEEESPRTRKIRITLTYSATKQSTRPQLNRWLDRFSDSNRRGAEIDFEYVIDRGSWRNGGYKQRPLVRTNASDRANEEASKILKEGRVARGFYF